MSAADQPGRPAPRDDLGLMAGYHSPQLDVKVKLNTNESPEPPPQAWVAEVAEAARDVVWHRYPDREVGELRSALGELHGVSPDQVLVANGSNEVLQALLLTYAGAARTVATWEPTYALHSHIARITGAGVVSGERDSDFALDLAEVERVVAESSPSVAFLCSPNNPTGVTDTAEQVRQVLEVTSAAGCLLVVDEAYAQFAPWSALELVTDSSPLVVTRTFSKTWAMAGARLGYLVGPRWVAEQVSSVLLPYHVDALRQRAGLLALAHHDEMEARVVRLVTERDRVEAALGARGVRTWPSGANFVLFRPLADSQVAAGDPDAARAIGDAVWKALVDRSVLVRNCASWPRLAGCLRVTIGTPAENDAFLDALGEALDEIRKQDPR